MGTTLPGVRTMYRRLLHSLGPQHWWPARTPFEMMVGAILTQATNWLNVERAIARLRRLGGLEPSRLLALPRRRVESAIRPAGYFRQKAARLQAFAQWYLTCYGGHCGRMSRRPWEALRQELLAVKGIGPETADSILLYAGRQPVFVVDAYTIRVFRRHRFIRRAATYETIQRWVMRELPPDAQMYNEFHALLVAVGKRHCHRRRPDCDLCPLGDFPHARIEV